MNESQMLNKKNKNFTQKIYLLYYFINVKI